MQCISWQFKYVYVSETYYANYLFWKKMQRWLMQLHEFLLLSLKVCQWMNQGHKIIFELNGKPITIYIKKHQPYKFSVGTKQKYYFTLKMFVTLISQLTCRTYHLLMLINTAMVQWRHFLQKKRLLQSTLIHKFILLLMWEQI